jgi:hypothetical protein
VQGQVGHGGIMRRSGIVMSMSGTRKYARPVAEHSGSQSKHTASVVTGAANGLGLAPTLAALNAVVTSRTRDSPASRQAMLRPSRPQNESPPTKSSG